MKKFYVGGKVVRVELDEYEKHKLAEENLKRLKEKDIEES